ncbi:hypothetical protein FQZ97_684100 [compost metagenome]
MNRKLSTLFGPARLLDGGVVFGALPRQCWVDWLRPDDHNRVRLESRALLVQEAGRNILVLAGSDALLAPPSRTCRCQPYGKGLLDGLQALGLGERDIQGVVLTHLHAFLSAELQAAVHDGDTPRLLFPAARYFVGRRHWMRACHPHPRDRALFVPQLLDHLEESGRLELIEGRQCADFGTDWHFHVSDGYTPGQLLPEIAMPGGAVVFAGDLVPGIHWLRLDITSSFDRNPEYLVDEKEQLLDHLVASGGRLVLSRDPGTAMIRVLRDRQSRYQPYDQHPAIVRMDC